MNEELADIYRRLSATLRQQADEIGVYSHPTGRGDGREELIRSLLADRVGSSFAVSKAEIVDADARRSSEIDATIFDQNVASQLHVQTGRALVRVESVAVTVEVKSDLTARSVDEHTAAVRRLAQLNRRYATTAFFDNVLAPYESMDENWGRELYSDGLPSADLKDSFETAMAEKARLDEFKTRSTNGIGALEPSSPPGLIPAIVSLMLAYRGPSIDTALSYLAEAACDGICVLGEYTVVKKGPGEATGPRPRLIVGRGADALGGFLQVIEHVLQQYRSSRQWVWPDTRAYFKSIVESGEPDHV